MHERAERNYPTFGSVFFPSSYYDSFQKPRDLATSASLSDCFYTVFYHILLPPLLAWLFLSGISSSNACSLPMHLFERVCDSICWRIIRYMYCILYSSPIRSRCTAGCCFVWRGEGLLFISHLNTLSVMTHTDTRAHTCTHVCTKYAPFKRAYKSLCSGENAPEMRTQLQCFLLCTSVASRLWEEY